VHAVQVSVLVGIDLGDRRIGVASGDSESGAVTPLLTLRRATPQRDAEAIGRIIEERGAEALVVGLPLHSDGQESEQSAITRDWVATVTPLLDVPVTLRDERFTSQAAEQRMGRPARGRSGGPPSLKARNAWRARIDREAAAFIVQAELDARAIDRQGASS
jgi:putative Holliday junction resolvase